MACLCPLCGSADCEVVDSMNVGDLVDLYRRQCGVDLRQDFAGHSVVSLRRCHACDLRYYLPQVTGTEPFYQALQTRDWYYMEDKSEYECVRAHIGPDDDVLEIGAGRGAFARSITCRSYTGLEFSQSAIDRALSEGVHLCRESVEDHAETHDKQYSVVCSFQVLEHVAAAGSFLASCVKCLRPGGLLGVSVPSEDGFVSRLPNSILNMPPHHLTRWSDRALKNVCRLLPLELVRLEHELLAPMHLGGYVRALVYACVCKSARARPRLMDWSYRYQLTRVGARVMMGFYRNIPDILAMAVGHSVTAVYRRTA